MLETVYVIAPSSYFEGLGMDESCPSIGDNAKVWLGEDGDLVEDKDWEGRVWRVFLICHNAVP